MSGEIPHHNDSKIGQTTAGMRRQYMHMHMCMYMCMCMHMHMHMYHTPHKEPLTTFAFRCSQKSLTGQVKIARSKMSRGKF